MLGAPARARRGAADLGGDRLPAAGRADGRRHRTTCGAAVRRAAHAARRRRACRSRAPRISPRSATVNRFDGHARLRAPARAGATRTAGARPGRRRCGVSRCACARCCRAGASSRCRASPGCATSSGRCPAAGRRSSSPRTTTSRPRRRASSAPTTAPPARPPSSTSRARSPARRGAATDRAVRFVLFDGEEEPAGCQPFLSCGIRGSKAYAKRHAAEIQSLILLDYIAEKHGLQLPARGRLGHRPVGAAARGRRTRRRRHAVPERHSRARSSTTTRRSRSAGSRRSTSSTSTTRRATRSQDTIDKVSARSLDAVGETVVRLLGTLRRGASVRASEPPPDLHRRAGARHEVAVDDRDEDAVGPAAADADRLARSARTSCRRCA